MHIHYKLYIINIANEINKQNEIHISYIISCVVWIVLVAFFEIKVAQNRV